MLSLVVQWCKSSPRQSRETGVPLGGGEVAAGVWLPGVVVADRRCWVVGLGDGVPEGHHGVHGLAVESENIGLDGVELVDSVLVGECWLEGDSVLAPQLHSGGYVELAIALGPWAINPEENLVCVVRTREQPLLGVDRGADLGLDRIAGVRPVVGAEVVEPEVVAGVLQQLRAGEECADRDDGCGGRLGCEEDYCDECKGKADADSERQRWRDEAGGDHRDHAEDGNELGDAGGGDVVVHSTRCRESKSHERWGPQHRLIHRGLERDAAHHRVEHEHEGAAGSADDERLLRGCVGFVGGPVDDRDDQNGCRDEQRDVLQPDRCAGGEVRQRDLLGVEVDLEPIHLGEDDFADREECGERTDGGGGGDGELFGEGDVVIGFVGMKREDKPERPGQENPRWVDHHEPTHGGAGEGG